MASHTPIYQRLFGDHYLDGLLGHLDLTGSAEREIFESLWRQSLRHAPLFGCADHPDVDSEHLDHVRNAVHDQLAGFARRGADRAVEHHAVRTFVTALRDSRGLSAPPPDPATVALIGSAMDRLCAAARCRHVPLVEMFWYHRSLDRHYSVHTDWFTELIDWTVAALDDPDAPDYARRFVADMQRLSPPESVEQAPQRVARGASGGIDIPASVRACPVALAALATASAPAHDAELGSGHPLSQRWYGALAADTRAAGLDELSAADVGAPKALPPLVENSLLVHLLGLEDRRHKAVLSDAADRLLVHRLIPLAREVGAKTNRHEPLAGYLVAVVASALRPWRFDAPPLTTEHRSVLIYLLAELATGKSRKLLHQEKQHADRRDEPDVIRSAVNRALARWPKCVHRVTPRQRIDRVAAGFRYLNRARRGTDPRARDIAIVAEIIAGR